MQEDLIILNNYILNTFKDNIEVIISSQEEEQFFFQLLNYYQVKPRKINVYLKDSACLTSIIWTLYTIYDGQKINLQIFLQDTDLTKINFSYLKFLQNKLIFSLFLETGYFLDKTNYQYADYFDKIILKVSPKNIFATPEEDWIIYKNIYHKIYLEEDYSQIWSEQEIEKFLTLLDKTISCKLSSCDFNTERFLRTHPIQNYFYNTDNPCFCINCNNKTIIPRYYLTEEIFQAGIINNDYTIELGASYNVFFQIVLVNKNLRINCLTCPIVNQCKKEDEFIRLLQNGDIAIPSLFYCNFQYKKITFLINKYNEILEGAKNG